MSLFDDILTLSKKIAASILGNEKPTDLEDSKLFGQEDKDHILKSLTDTYELKERQRLQQQIDRRKDWKVIQKRTEIPVRKLPYWKYASAAAVFIAVLTIGYFYQQGAFHTADENMLVPTNASITLQLEDGTIQVIDPNATKDVRDIDGNLVASQAQSQLDYSETNAMEELVYNTLKVPYGKRFDVVLSDGTIIYLNSGTELKYPVSFLSEGNREVFVEGEAYFDVTSDKARPFIVNAEALNVEVLGTEFNVLAYPEDGFTDVVLVEGSVGMYDDVSADETATILSPGFKGVYNKTAQSIATEKVNTSVYTAWRNGELVFRQMPLDNILKKLERHYNITIVNNNKALGQEVFNASFKDQSIEKVLGYLNSLYGIEYKIENNRIIIN